MKYDEYTLRDYKMYCSNVKIFLTEINMKQFHKNFEIDFLVP